jgi:hypothetical protein
MIVVGLISEILGILNQLLANFVAITIPVATNDTTNAQADGEIILTTSVPLTTAKGNALTGAIADIMTSGAQLVDLILQTLVGFNPTAPVTGYPGWSAT